MNPAKRIKLNKEAEDSSRALIQITNEQTFIDSQKELPYRSENNFIILHIKHVLKNVLSKFLSKGVLLTNQNPPFNFAVETKSLEELVEDMMDWNLYTFLTEKNKANIVLLHEKISCLGLGNKDDSLSFLSAVEDLFHLIQKMRPNLCVPIELIQEYRAAYVNDLTACNDSESQFPTREYEKDKSAYELLSDTWIAINHISGVILDHFEIPHDFEYYSKTRKFSDLEIRYLIVNAYPNIYRIKKLLHDIFDAANICQSVKIPTKMLASALLGFIPSLKLPVETKTYPFFNASILENWLTSPQNRPAIVRAIMQIDKYCSKLEEAFHVTANYKKLMLKFAGRFR